MTMPNLSSETSAAPSVRSLIFDLDGVIWRGHTPIPGAVESVLRLRENGIRCFYATNNSSLLQSEFADRLRAIGLELEDAEVVTSAAATAWHLQEHFGGRPFTAYAVGEHGIKIELERIGAQVLTDEEADITARVDVVVVGIDRTFSYERLRLAQKLLLRDALFVATNMDWTFPTEQGIVPGSGSVVAAVQAAAQRQPLVIGKPAPAMLLGCVERFGLDASTCVMVGDRLDTDIACGHRAGLRSFWVATGVHTREHVAQAQGDEVPDALFENLSELADAILGG